MDKELKKIIKKFKKISDFYYADLNYQNCSSLNVNGLTLNRYIYYEHEIYYIVGTITYCPESRLYVGELLYKYKYYDDKLELSDLYFEGKTCKEFEKSFNQAVKSLLEELSS